MKRTLLLCLLAVSQPGHAQTWPATIAIVDSAQDCSIRGMSIPRKNVVWVSGSNGHVARSTDGGKTWKWMVVAGYEKTDFRDIHAFDSATAVIMGVDNPAYILKTRDGGRTWKTVFTKEAPGMFLDAMDFRNDGEGICIGDPMDAGGKKRTFFVIRTKDRGDTWQQEPSGRLPQAQTGEAVFSASGTNIALLDSKDFDYAAISGGRRSNLYLIGRKRKPDKAVSPLRIIQGTESSGAFSMATDRVKAFYCIGGDYKNPDATNDNFVWTGDGKSWKTPDGAPPSGYRSCVIIIDGQKLVACGSNGVDICNSPNSWKRISAEGFNVCAVSPDKKLIFFGGGKGKIGLLKL